MMGVINQLKTQLKEKKISTQEKKNSILKLTGDLGILLSSQLIVTATRKVQVFEIHFTAMKILAEYYIDL